MFTRIQAKGYRCLRQVDQTIGPFQALVGPNASGKTTFLDVLTFLSDILRLRGSIPDAVGLRTSNFSDLLWKGEGQSFQIVVEAEIPEHFRKQLMAHDKHFEGIRYEIQVGIDRDNDEIGLDHESLSLFARSNSPTREQRRFFPEEQTIPASILLPKRGKGRKLIVNKLENGNDNFYPEMEDLYRPSYRLGRTRSALANLPPDQTSFPLSLWFRDMLELGVQNLILDSQKLRQPTPPGSGRKYRTDGSNLPLVIGDLKKNPKRYQLWMDHVRTSLEDVSDVDVIERENDKNSYLAIRYFNGARVPSWVVSDGTLRLLALTIPAYLGDYKGVLLVEEPENGIHPKALETITQSLTSIYNGQVLIATHSPIVISQLEQGQILCFAKNSEGATDIVSGLDHPRLRDWKKGCPDLGILAASGVLS